MVTEIQAMLAEADIAAEVTGPSQAPLLDLPQDGGDRTAPSRTSTT
jgi:hypothetical protein